MINEASNTAVEDGVSFQLIFRESQPVWAPSLQAVVRGIHRDLEEAVLGLVIRTLDDRLPPDYHQSQNDLSPHPHGLQCYECVDVG